MSLPTHVDERAFAVFERLTASDFVQYLWLLATRDDRTRAVVRSFLSAKALFHKAIARLVLRLAMTWVDRSVSEPQRVTATSDPVDGSREASGGRVVHDPVITYTPSGSPVIDRRRVRIESDATPTEDPLVEPSSAQRDWRARVQALTRVLVGAIIRWSSASPIPAISNYELIQQMLESRAHRAIVAGRVDDALDLSKVLGVASGDFVGDWRVAAYQWMKRYASRLRLEEIVSRELGGTGAPARHCAVLRLIPHVASSLSDDHARAALAILLATVERAIDPYDSSGEVVLARSAVVALLRQRPELHDAVQDALSGQQAADESSTLPQLIALALRSRGLGASLPLGDVAVNGRLSPEEFESVAKLADAPLRSLPDPVVPTGRGALIPDGPLTRRLACWSFVGAVCTGVALVLRASFPTVGPVEVQIAPAIATLALLATVQVFAANLAGARLPGVIARHTSQSWQLDLAYGASLALVGLAIWQPSQPARTLLRNWMSSVALILWVCSLIISLLAVFRRVDSARAAAGFVSIRKRRARLMGRRLGRYQASTIELKSLIESSGSIEIQTEAIAGAWDRPIISSSRGIFLPSRSGVRQLLASKAMRDGLRVRITSVLGVTVNRYDILAHALPLAEQSVGERWLSNASRKLKVRTNRRVDDINSASLALLKLTSDLADTGDTGTAEQVAQSLTEFVNFHMAHTRRAREAAVDRWRVREGLMSTRNERLVSGGQVHDKRPIRSRDEADSAPVNPIFLAVLQAASRFAVTADGPFLNTLEYLIRSILRPSSVADLGVTIVASALTLEEIDSVKKTAAAHRLLRTCALHALEQRHRSNFKFVLDSVSRLVKGKAAVNMSRDLVSELTAFACRYDPDIALAGVKTLEKLYDDHPAGAESASGAGHFWQAGAASVAVGAQSVAVHLAEVMHRRDLTSWVIAASVNRNILDTYAVRSEMFGGFLGSQPRDALATFGGFLKRYETWLTAIA